MKKFLGKALYQPSGKAAEYSEWAVNFYTGCSNDCDYCYCKRGVLSHVWNTTPKLKKCFKDKTDALKIFEKELLQNLDEVKKTGILFSFTTDPLLPETRGLTLSATRIATNKDVPVKILTKRADDFMYELAGITLRSDLVAFGFTLTGHDEIEPNASSNEKRKEAMSVLHRDGFKTWASIEPVISVEKSLEMIKSTHDFCDLYKIGLMSGVKRSYYTEDDLAFFLTYLHDLAYETKIYIKESVFEWLGISRLKYELEMDSNFVQSDYNIFKQ